MVKHSIEQLLKYLEELNSQASSPLFPSPPTSNEEKRKEANDALKEYLEGRKKEEKYGDNSQEEYHKT